MASNPETNASVTLVDRSGEVSRFSLNIKPSTVADWTTPGTLPNDSAVGQFLAALGTVIDGAILRRSLTTTLRVANVPFAAAGQREERWLLVYQDNVTLQLYTQELPCRKASLLPPPNQDEVDLTVAPWPNFKAKFEALVNSPEGNPVTLLSVRLIGRNL